MQFKRELFLETHPTCVHRAREFVADYLSECGVAEVEAFDILLALNEAVANALRHASAEGDRVRIKVTCVVQGNALCLEVSDTGLGFRYRPGMAGLPDAMSSSGRGFFLMNELMDDVSVVSSRSGTRIQMTRQLPSGVLANS